MEGDVVKILAKAQEENGVPVISAEISEKPQFMLDEEYHQLIIECAVEAVREACMRIYPDDKKTRGMMAQMISMRATK